MASRKKKAAKTPAEMGVSAVLTIQLDMMKLGPAMSDAIGKAFNKLPKDQQEKLQTAAMEFAMMVSKQAGVEVNPPLDPLKPPKPVRKVKRPNPFKVVKEPTDG